jgi:hypothetical protein
MRGHVARMEETLITQKLCLENIEGRILIEDLDIDGYNAKMVLYVHISFFRTDLVGLSS